MKLKNIIAGLLISSALSSCVTMVNPDPTQFNEPTVTLTSVSADVTTITMTASLSNGAAVTYGFNYGYSSAMELSKSASFKESDKTFTLTIPVEQYNSQFYCQAYIENSFGKKVVSETKTITTPAIPAGGVTLNTTSVTLKEGETTTLTATVTPETALDKSVSWRSNNESVATVTADGLVTAIKAGMAQIIVKTNDGGYEAVCDIAVIAPVAGLTLDKSSAMLQEGSGMTLKATVLPENASNPKLTWSSSDKSVVSVTDGNVTAEGSGIADITATVSDEFGSFSATCRIYVSMATADLGLSVKWSGLNLGAANPLNPGNRYAWAETEPKESYSWDNYLYGNGTSVTKYCLDRAYGMIDYLSVLVASDDVASVKSQSNWHIPTAEEWKELQDKCKWELMTIDGTMGYMISGSGDHSSDWIFLPLCGRKTGSSQEDEGSTGWYWTSNLDSGSSLKAQSFKIDQSGQAIQAVERSTGMAVRTVQGNSPSIPVLAVMLDKSKASVMVGDELNLTATVYPVSASNSKVSWSSSNSGVASVDKNGKVTALAYGTATITVTTEDGGKSAACEVTVLPHVSEVKLNRSSLLLKTGDSETLTATVLPEEAPNRSVTWSSSKPEVATVDENGKVTAVASGTTTVTVMSVDGNKSAICTVTVTPKLESVTLDITELTLDEGDAKDIVATIKPEDASISSVSWTSSAPSVASVTYSLDGNVSKAKVKGNAAGTAEIRVTVTDIHGDSKSASCSVKVNQGDIMPTYIKLNKSFASINMGESKTIAELGLSAEVGPDNATDKSVSWTSAAPSIFTVTAEGVVTAISTGAADLIATTVNGLKATCTISVIKQ